MRSHSTTGGSRSSAAGTVAAQERIARHQHAAEALRARSVLVVACALWLVVGVALDTTTHGTIGRGELWVVIAIRLAISSYHVAVLALLFRRPLPSPALVRPLVAAIFPVTSLGLMLIATRMGGLSSAYVTGLFVIQMAQATAMPMHWRSATLLATLTTVIYPAGLLIAAGFDDLLAAQLRDRQTFTVFAIFIGVLIAGATVSAWGSHVIWSLRQSVFESRSIGRYKLVRRIGKGGMGEVWRAHDKAMRRDVALKILNPESGKHPAAVARFEREIQATAELSHAHTVRIHDWGVTDDGVWYYAMELLDGVDLSSLVRRSGPLPPALAVHLGIQAAQAIAEAHARGIVHRDLKPGNLFVMTHAAGGGDAEAIKVLDFGIARIGDDDDGLTQAGAVVGTPGFMAPEVVAGAPGGLPADVYGLAATLFFALTGKSPRDAGAGSPPSALVSGIPVDLDDAIVRALDADPARRPASGAELAAELSSCRLAGVWTGSWQLGDLTADIPDEVPGAEATLDAGSPETRADAPGAIGRGATPGSRG